jgi:hypothetical protein
MMKVQIDLAGLMVWMEKGSSVATIMPQSGTNKEFSVGVSVGKGGPVPNVTISTKVYGQLLLEERAVITINLTKRGLVTEKIELMQDNLLKDGTHGEKLLFVRNFAGQRGEYLAVGEKGQTWKPWDGTHLPPDAVTLPFPVRY